MRPHRVPVLLLTCCQLVLFHGGQAEHIGIFPSIGLIKGLNVDGELLHERAGESEGRRASIRTTLRGAVAAC
jgi:hypothetical protein